MIRASGWQTWAVGRLGGQGRGGFPADSLDLLLPLPRGPAAAMELEGHVLDADVLETPERLDELLGCAPQAVLLLGHRLGGDVDGANGTELDRTRIPARLGGPLLQLPEASGQLLGPRLHEIRGPGLAVLGRPPLGRLAFPADPDGEARLLDRPGIDGHLAEPVVATFEVRPLFLPEQVEDLQLLLGHARPVLEVDPQRLELLGHPADPDAAAASSVGH